MCKSLETLSSCISSLSEYTVYSRYIFVKRSKKQGVSFLPHAAKHLKTLNDKKKKCLSLIFCFYLILIVVFPWDDDTVYLRNRNALLPPPLCRYKSSTVKHEEAIWERLLLLFSFVSGLSLQHSKPFFFFGGFSVQKQLGLMFLLACSQSSHAEKLQILKSHQNFYAVSFLIIFVHFQTVSVRLLIILWWFY